MVRPANFEISQRGDRSLAIAGELDMNTVAQLSAYVEERLRIDTAGLTLDLREVSFMDSSGLRVLIELHDSSRTEGWELRLIPPRHEAAVLVLRATGADAVLPFEDGGGS